MATTWSRPVRAGASGGATPQAGPSRLDRGSPDFTALCFGAGGRGFVGGQTRGAHHDGTSWQPSAGIPDYGQLAAGWINGAACREDGSVVIGGYWSAAITSDAGATYAQYAIPTQWPGVEAQLAAIAEAPGGATVAVGYHDYVGTAARGADGTTTSVHPGTAAWWNAVTAVAGGTFWVVGDGGAILRSTDDGVSWSAQPSGTHENLYAVHFADALHGAAVGRRGTVVVTSDGGQQWTPRPLGTDAFLGAVHVDDTTITVADGLVATSPR